MATIFDTQPGAVAVLPSDDGPGLPLAIDGFSGSWFGAYKSILAGLSLALDGNVQFTHTLDDTIYIYTFGDRISQLRVDGLSFQGGCGDDGSGVEAILQAYDENKVASRSSPVQVQIGTSASGLFRGYMTGLRMEIVKPEARIAQFSLLLSVIPSGSSNQ